MTDTCNQTHCAFCYYRHAAGTLEITRTLAFAAEPACATCAQDALAYYAHRQGVRAVFRAKP